MFVLNLVLILAYFALPLALILRKPVKQPNRFGATPPACTFTQAIVRLFNHYLDFSGRASRSEFWFAMLFVVGGSVLLGAVDRSGLVEKAWAITTWLPATAVTCRRLHDVNRSGWWQILLTFVPVGLVWTLVQLCRRPED